MKNFKIKFNKTLDEMNGLDLTAIAYAVGLLVGLLWDINLTIVFTITSGLCAWVSFKKSKVALTILNASIFIYSLVGVWDSCIVVAWNDFVITPINEFFAPVNELIEAIKNFKLW
jgi:hypothetical protein